jgi:hypothetical protein
VVPAYFIKNGYKKSLSNVILTPKIYEFKKVNDIEAYQLTPVNPPVATDDYE